MAGSNKDVASEVNKDVASEVIDFGVDVSAGSENAKENKTPAKLPPPIPPPRTENGVAAGSSPSWFRQFRVALRKNRVLLQRRPLQLVVLVTSSMFSVLFAWLAGRDSSEPFPPLTECGLVNPDYFFALVDDDWAKAAKIPVTLNEAWRSGLPVALMSLGPLAASISAFLLVRDDISTRRWGALRSAGLPESAHWASWFVAFALPAPVNSLLAAALAALLPDANALSKVYFAGTFAALCLLTLALNSAAFLLAAVNGTLRGTTVLLLIISAMIIANFVPQIVASLGYRPLPDVSTNTYDHPVGSNGIFWSSGSTQRGKINYDYTYDERTGDSQRVKLFQDCQVPLVSYQQGHLLKTPEQRDQVTKEELFQGCYFIAGGATKFVHNTASQWLWFMVPQTHFLYAWSNFVGYTALPGNEFSHAQASASPEDLAAQSLLNYNGEESFEESATNGTSLFPQGSTILTERFTFPYPSYSESNMINSSCPSTDVSNVCNSYNRECNHLSQGYPTASSPSVNDSLGFLASLIIIYALLAAYWVQVFPMGNGSALKFYFPFQPSYWMGVGRSTGSHKEKEGEGGAAVSTDSASVGVEAVGVKKSYGKVQALKPFSISMRVGEVTALLGHNGAGKSTFANLLCCEENPTDGDIFVFGRSVANNHHAVRRLVGQCKQDDLLWPDLSAREHLEMFAGIRGVDPEQLPAVVQRWLESVDLDVVQNDFVKSFSGGTKRRLSVSLATIGDSPVVVLDEPTTGMDPVSRRFVWRHIDEIKEGRVVLLTTHAMEEADLLADVVAIMRSGQLATIGTPLELKSKYGSALQFSLITERENVRDVEDSIKQQFASALDWIKVDSAESGYVTLNIKKVCVDDAEGDREGVLVSSLSDFIRWLEDPVSPVTEYGFSNSSLEEVFLAVTHQSDPGQSPVDEDNVIGCCKCCRSSKNRTSVETTSIAINNSPGANMNQPKTNIADYTRTLSVTKQTFALFRFYFERNWTGTGNSSIVNWVVFSLFALVNMLLGFVMATAWPNPYMYIVVTVSLLSLMLVSVIAPVYSDRESGLLRMMSTQGMFDKSYLLANCSYSLAVQLAYTFVFMTLFYASTIFRDAVKPVCEDGQYDCRYATFGSRPTVEPWQRRIRSFDAGFYKGVPVNLYAHQTSGGYGMILAITIIFSLSFPGAALSSSFLPGYKLPLIAISVLVLVSCASPMILYSNHSLDIYFRGNCTEKVETIYNCTENVFNLLNVTDDFINCVGWELNDQMIYCSPTYASILPQIGLFQTLSFTLMADIVFSSEPEEYVSEVLLPRLEGAVCSGDRCKFPFVREAYGNTLGYMFLGAFLLLVLGIGMAYIFVDPFGFVLRARRAFRALLTPWKRKEGSESSGLEASPDSKEFEEVSAERKIVHGAIQPIVNDNYDFGTNSYGRIPLNSSKIDRDTLPPVLVHKLRKVFPSLGGAPSKVALKSLDLHVPKGQVLGLLGKNGAGKTTVLKILSGMHDASSGIGLIAGYDVANEGTSVSECLGNCPQFDIVWRDQSAKRHLEFYARLKGIAKAEEAAKEIAAAVGLGDPGVYTRPSGKLSGGMRRRLSIAISMIGAPNVLLLDEPTTGLDPSTRNEIWGLLNSFATVDRAVIITTHMMVEADTLCSRIAIIARGALKVIASQQHLKDKYGSGYLLQLNLLRSNAAAIDTALQYVQSNIHEGARLVTKHAKTIHVNLPRDVNIQKIFTMLYNSESSVNGGINQFLVSQSSLEDVFIALGE